MPSPDKAQAQPPAAAPKKPQAGSPAPSAAGTLRIEYYRSAIGRSWRQKLVVRGLGFTKLRQVVARPDNPGIRGMVAKIPHLVRILEDAPPASGPGGRKSRT